MEVAFQRCEDLVFPYFWLNYFPCPRSLESEGLSQELLAECWRLLRHLRKYEKKQTNPGLPSDRKARGGMPPSCQSQLCTGAEEDLAPDPGSEEGELWAWSALHLFPNHRWLQVSSSLLSMVPLCTCLKVTSRLKLLSDRSPIPLPLLFGPSEALCSHAHHHCQGAARTHPSDLSS